MWSKRGIIIKKSNFLPNDIYPLYIFLELIFLSDSALYHANRPTVLPCSCDPESPTMSHQPISVPCVWRKTGLSIHHFIRKRTFHPLPPVRHRRVKRPQTLHKRKEILTWLIYYGKHETRLWGKAIQTIGKDAKRGMRHEQRWWRGDESERGYDT